ncbi:hypothetical protein Btru_058314 [Bulinus truncatus]|nr:hypothetical protein Btru_058314 [Bulinus truncatus]
MRVFRISSTVVGLLLLWIQFDSVDGFQRITSGTAGTVCEDNYRKCPKGTAVCTNQTCACPEGYNGRGSFTCFPRGYKHMAILNDPVFHTFTGDAAHVNYPCRYPVAHFITKFQSKPDSTCEVKIHAFNRYIRGKNYVYGFDVALNISVYVPNRYTSSIISFRKVGSACNGTYTYEEQGTLKYAPDGPWQKFSTPLALDMFNEVVRLRHNPITNFAYLEVLSCAFRIDFRAYDICRDHRQPQVPGLAVSVKSDAVKRWVSGNTFLSFFPGHSLRDFAKTLKMSLEEALLFSFIQSKVEQNQPHGPSQCDSLHEIAKRQEHKQKLAFAMGACMFILSSPPFVNCYDRGENGKHVLPLYTRCIRSYRNKSLPDCDNADPKVCQCVQRVNSTPTQYNYKRICCRIKPEHK